ncbi:MAG: AbrB/MazE/SpoVT family DNA-binding domain-containing protein [Gemmatimonadetes bacterium]|nr:AbrB/MazE/SpoVT family DNA-binding domain-containing protein [Gemmatimonadota bacterium]
MFPMIKSTLTEKWQTTIPAEVRRALHLKPRQRLIYELIDGGVVVRAQPETLKDLYGFLADGKTSSSKSEERDVARKARVARYK